MSSLVAVRMPWFMPSSRTQPLPRGDGNVDLVATGAEPHLSRAEEDDGLDVGFIEIVGLERLDAGVAEPRR